MDSSLTKIVLSRWKGQRKTWLCLAISVVLIGLLISLVDLRIVFSAIVNIRLSIFAGSILVAGLLPVFSTFRWLAALKGVGMNISYRKAFPVIMSAFVINALVPSKGGEIFKAVFLRREGSITTLIGSVIIERFVDVLILTILAVFGALIIGHKHFIAASALVLLIVFGMGTILFVWTPDFLLKGGLGKKLKAVRNSFNQMRKTPKRIIEVGFWSLMVWVTAVFQATLVIWALGGQISILYVFAVLPLALFIGMLPFSISGIGTRDSAMLLLFAGVLTNPIILAAAILYTFNAYWLPAFIGIPFFSVSLSRAVAAEEGITH